MAKVTLLQNWSTVPIQVSQICVYKLISTLYISIFILYIPSEKKLKKYSTSITL